MIVYDVPISELKTVTDLSTLAVSAFNKCGESGLSAEIEMLVQIDDLKYHVVDVIYMTNEANQPVGFILVVGAEVDNEGLTIDADELEICDKMAGSIQPTPFWGVSVRGTCSLVDIRDARLIYVKKADVE